MEIHIAENHHGAQQTKWYDASQLWTAHPRGPWRSNHMHHLCRRDFLHQLGLVMRCWNLTRNYAFFHLLYLVNQETAKGKAKAADNRCNCTTENDGFKMNEFTAQELGPNCPGVANHHIYIYHHLLTSSPTRSNPRVARKLRPQRYMDSNLPQPRNLIQRRVIRHWKCRGTSKGMAVGTWTFFDFSVRKSHRIFGLSFFKFHGNNLSSD